MAAIVLNTRRSLRDCLQEAARKGYRQAVVDGSTYEISDGQPGPFRAEPELQRFSFRPLPWGGDPDFWLSCFMARVESR